MRGTAKELVEQGICCNGVRLDQAMLSVLFRVLGPAVAQRVGVAERPGGKGKPATIWEIVGPATLTFDFNETVSDHPPGHPQWQEGPIKK